MKPPKFFRQMEAKLRRAQCKLFRCQKGSNRRQKQKHVVGGIHEKIKNQRQYFVAGLSAKYMRENDLVAVEDLNVKGMVQNKYLAKSISDAAWSQFIQ